MRRQGWQIALVMLLIGCAVLLSGCGKPKQEQQAAAPTQQAAAPAGEQAAVLEDVPLAGDYVIDITDLGMALQFYLRINEDNTFMLSPNRQFNSDRGTGKIGEMDGTYVMIYSDSTPEVPKTATFEREGHNLVFRTTLPYGTANIMYERVDEENPDLVYRLVAHKYIYEEYYDTYLAFREEEGAEYEYVLNLLPGARYTLVSSLEGSEVYRETGTFRVAGSSIVLTPVGEEDLPGTVSADGALELEVKPKAEAERGKTLFRVATTAEHAGTWLAQTQTQDQAVLELDFFGGYVYKAGELEERGTFQVEQRAISFRPAEGEAREGTKTPYTLEAAFGAEDLVFYNAQIVGQFTGGTMSSETLQAKLELTAAGEYTLTILDEENGIELMHESGTFEIVPGPMAYQLQLQAGETARVGDIWPTGFNMSFQIDGTDYRFLLTF